MNKYGPVIGLEIHVELKTKSKMFCGCDADYFAKEANTNVCPVCLGLPGAMPVPNKKAVEWTVLIGKALNCKISSVSKFDRKHYFYPDLPKGFQISQYDEPIATKGFVEIKNSQAKSKKFRITRVHLEEDTAKLLHLGVDTLVDFNRSGVPLVEIVSEPDFDNSEDVKNFLEELHTLIRYLDVSDADMEKGSMRMEPNISVKLQSSTKLPAYKVEVKNINSFNFVKKAIEYELERQTELLEKDETPKQETRGFDSKKNVTYSQRSKEEAQDYRYFPEPDIPPLNFSNKYVEDITLPELPAQRVNRYMSQGIKYQDAFTLSRNRELGDKFEKTLKLNAKGKVKVIDIANALINRKEMAALDADNFYRRLSEDKGPKKFDEKALQTAIVKVIEVNNKAVDDYKNGKQNAVMFLVGQVMREMKGRADAQTVRQKLEKILQSK